ncbi:MAG: HNH endonuclease signature motif containing protein, partial [Acidimicrobiales bacterium]
RSIPAHLKTALQFRDRCCVVPGCGRTFGLEYDHIVEFAKGGPTTLDNLCRLCRPHHGLKTHKGYRISGGPGHWEWVGPRRAREQGEGAAPAAARPQAEEPSSRSEARATRGEARLF